MKLRLLLDIIRSRRKSLVALLLLFVLDAGLILYSYYVQAPKIDTLYSTWSQKRASLAQRKLTSEAEIYRRGEHDIAEFNASIPPKRDFVRLIGKLYDAAAKNDLKVGAITYKPSMVKGRPLYDFSISVLVTGKYANIKRFIGEVNRDREMLIVDGISLASSLIDESVRLKMDMTVFMKQEER